MIRITNWEIVPDDWEVAPKRQRSLLLSLEAAGLIELDKSVPWRWRRAQAKDKEKP